MKRLALGFAVLATPAAAHHEMVTTVSLLPVISWVAAGVGVSIAAIWAKRRRK